MSGSQLLILLSRLTSVITPELGDNFRETQKQPEVGQSFIVYKHGIAFRLNYGCVGQQYTRAGLSIFQGRNMLAHFNLPSLTIEWRADPEDVRHAIDEAARAMLMGSDYAPVTPDTGRGDLALNLS